MCKVNKIKGKIVEKGLSMTKFADLIGMHRSALYRKLSNPDDKFTIREANKIRTVLKLTKEEAMDIFFSDDVA